MYNIELFGMFIKLMDIFHYFGLWVDNEEEITTLKRAKRFFTFIYYVSFLISLGAGAYVCESMDESIYLLSTTVTNIVLTTKLYYMLWKGNKISAFLHIVSRHSMRDHNEFLQIKEKLENFVTFAKGFILMTVTALTFLSTMCLPIFSSQKNLPFNVGFPLNWKTSEVSYWIAYTFVVIASFMAIHISSFNTIVWYIMLNCSIKYQLLGKQLRNMGECELKSEQTTLVKKSLISEDEEQKAFIRELIGLIESHQSIRELINRAKSLLSNLLLVIITTSGILICNSVYVLAFSGNATLLQSAIYLAILFYNGFDIFMVMYFGNEIVLESDRLSYSLFQSNWVKHSTTSKKYIIILTEILKQPHELVIFKLYKLNMGTFTSILNLAYSMFNILKNFS